MLKKAGVLLTAGVLISGLLILKPLKRVTPDETPGYAVVMRSLDTMDFRGHTSKFMTAGWAKANITPRKPVALAGYGRRYPDTGVHDSLYLRVMILDNGNRREAIVTMDLLLFPKTLAEKIRAPQLLRQLGLDGIYTGVTHTHSSFGHWDNSLVGNLVFGKYDPALIDSLTGIFANTVTQATEDLDTAVLCYKKISVPGLMYNRLDKEHGRIDPWLRAIEVERKSGSKAVIVSYPAHPINIDSEIRELSRDYPGALTDRLESDDHIEFAMFLAGMVGSHHLKPDGRKDFGLTEYAGHLLAQKILNSSVCLPDSTGFRLGFNLFDSEIHISRMRIGKDLALRDWLFRLALGPLEGHVEVLRAGNILLIGLPGDFSGEIAVNSHLDSLAESKGMHLFITSFNGDYIGYITEDKYYDTVDKDEVRFMNWIGPYKGQYFSDIIKKIIEKS